MAYEKRLAAQLAAAGKTKEKMDAAHAKKILKYFNKAICELAIGFRLESNQAKVAALLAETRSGSIFDGLLDIAYSEQPTEEEN